MIKKSNLETIFDLFIPGKTPNTLNFEDLEERRKGSIIFLINQGIKSLEKDLKSNETISLSEIFYVYFSTLNPPKIDNQNISIYSLGYNEINFSAYIVLEDKNRDIRFIYDMITIENISNKDRIKEIESEFKL